MFREQPSTSDDHAWNSVEITIQDSEHMDKLHVWEEIKTIFVRSVKCLGVD